MLRKPCCICKKSIVDNNYNVFPDHNGNGNGKFVYVHTKKCQAILFGRVARDIDAKKLKRERGKNR